MVDLFLCTTLFRWVNFPPFGFLSDHSICFGMAFSLLDNFDHAVVSVTIDFPSKSKGDTPFHHTIYDYFPVDQDSLRDNLRDFPRKEIIKLFAYTAATKLACMTKLKLHNIPATPKLVKKVITNLDLSKAPGPNCIPVLFLENR